MLFWSSCRTIVARSFRASKGSAAEAFFVRLEGRITPSAPIRPTRWIQTATTAALPLGSLIDRFLDHLSQVFRLRFLHAGTICRGLFPRLGWILPQGDLD